MERDYVNTSKQLQGIHECLSGLQLPRLFHL